MLSQSIVRGAAARLLQAGETRMQLRQLHLEFPDMDMGDAYAIQREWLGLRLAAGRRVVGHKIGLTSRAMQASAGIDEPDFGALLDDMLLANGSRVALARFIEPRVEIELAFILGKPLQGPHCTLFDVMDATAWVVPAIEIIDSRIQRTDPQSGSGRTIVDSVSDNAIAAGVMLGDHPGRPLAADLSRVAGVLLRNGQVEETGVAAAVLGHPANSVAWLANKLAQYGQSLLPGQVILAGSFIRPVNAQGGDTFHADFGPMGSVSFQFLADGHPGSVTT